MDTLVLVLFCAALLACLALDASILYALGFGLLLFSAYALRRGFSARDVLAMWLDGVKTARNVFTTFFIIGALTALWRAAGTIPAIVCYAAELITPSVFLLMSFLLCSALSVLTGTSFGTAATMGVICAAMGEAMQVPAAYTGGAVLAGSFFGDRCSPVSTSALLVAELTETNIFDNIRRMIKTAALPFALSCLACFLLGSIAGGGSAGTDLTAVFERELRLHWTALIPAIVVLLLSVFRVSVGKTLLLSILSAVPVCVLLQGLSFGELLKIAVLGYEAESAEAAAMLDGGGMVSMLSVAAIVCISSAYAGIFRKTGLLDGIRRHILALSGRATPYAAALVTAVLTSAIACNQTLSIMLTKQLCEGTEPDSGRYALNIEDSAVIASPLLPWTIGAAVPLASANAPNRSVLFAFFLYLLPICRLVSELLRRRRRVKA